jgi:hypothetical protein
MFSFGGITVYYDLTPRCVHQHSLLCVFFHQAALTYHLGLLIICPLIWTLLSLSPLQGTSVLSPVLHIGSVIILAMMIYKKSAIQLFEKHPCVYILAFGFVSAKITNKLVVSMGCCLLVELNSRPP